MQKISLGKMTLKCILSHTFTSKSKIASNPMKFHYWLGPKGSTDSQERSIPVLFKVPQGKDYVSNLFIFLPQPFPGTVCMVLHTSFFILTIKIWWLLTREGAAGQNSSNKRHGWAGIRTQAFPHYPFLFWLLCRTRIYRNKKEQFVTTLSSKYHTATLLRRYTAEC